MADFITIKEKDIRNSNHFSTLDKIGRVEEGRRLKQLAGGDANGLVSAHIASTSMAEIGESAGRDSVRFIDNILNNHNQVAITCAQRIGSRC